MSNDPICEVFRINKQLCEFSPDGKFLALIDHSELLLKNTGTFDNYLTFNCTEGVEDIKWSPNSQYILCYSSRNAIVQIFSVNFPEWKYKLIEGSSGLDSVLWAPDSKHIITIADLKIQLAVWCLTDNNVVYIRNLKSSVTKGIQFSLNGKYLAVILSENGKDSINLYKTSDWRLSKKLICEKLRAIDGISWSPNSETICIWCAISSLAKIIFYSVALENYEGVFYPDEFETKMSFNANINNNGLFDEKLGGLEIVKWISSGQLLAISGHNETIVILNCLTWRPLLQLRLEPVIKRDNYLTRVFKEFIVKQGSYINKINDKIVGTIDKQIQEIGKRPLNIPIVKSETLIGGEPASVTRRIIDILEFSVCGQYLAIRHQIYPGTLWIWDIRTNGIDILILQNSISAIKWDPIHPRLLIFTNNIYMFIWTSSIITCLDSPRGLTTLDARWHPFSDIIVLCGYNRAIVHNLRKCKFFNK